MVVYICQQRQKQRGLCRLKVPNSLFSCIKMLRKKEECLWQEDCVLQSRDEHTQPLCRWVRHSHCPSDVRWLVQLGPAVTQTVKLLKSTKWQTLLFLWEIFPYSTGYNPLDNNLELNVITPEISHCSNIQDTFLVYYPLQKKNKKRKSIQLNKVKVHSSDKAFQW